MKTPLMNLKAITFVLGAALFISAISDSYAQTPSPTPVQRKVKILPRDPAKGTPYSG
jgi:hypothetical protein